MPYPAVSLFKVGVHGLSLCAKYRLTVRRKGGRRRAAARERGP
jgi:hypothetical protein